ncbi:L7Ae/L30e/S12e/Gadd45 family ribosomal protein [Paenibacillus larvae]|uniref:L7Ae/L30e/S12e/Gadd45 family ribosomal protein n=1 Tax=Paenibacillus larvae TaxID=1464 RepID=UPI00016955E3
MSDKFYSYLGLTMRAGKLTTGEDGVLKAMRSGDAKLVILARDAGPNTLKKFSDKCRSYGIPLMIAGDRSQIGASIGKEARVVVGILDGGFAKMLQNCQVNPTEVNGIE